MECDHQYPELCLALGRHVSGRLLELWASRRDYRETLCRKAGVDVDAIEDSLSHTIRSRGVGDTVAKALKKVGIKPCGGCKKRQKALNRMFPYKSD